MCHEHRCGSTTRPGDERRAGLAQINRLMIYGPQDGGWKKAAATICPVGDIRSFGAAEAEGSTKRKGIRTGVVEKLGRHNLGIIRVKVTLKFTRFYTRQNCEFLCYFLSPEGPSWLFHSVEPLSNAANWDIFWLPLPPLLPRTPCSRPERGTLSASSSEIRWAVGAKI